MYANVKDRKIAAVLVVTGTGVVAGSTVDLRGESRIVDEFAVLMKGYTTKLVTPTVKNGGFETAGAGGADVFADWTETVQLGTVISQTAAAGEFHGGTKAMKVVVDALGTAVGSVDQDVLTTGKEYTVDLWAKGAAGGELLSVYHGVVEAAQFTLTNAWAHYTVTFTASAIKLYVMTTPDVANNAATMFVDDVTVTATVAESLAPTDFAGVLEASLDGGAYFTTLQAIVEADDGVIKWISGKPVDYFRLNVTALTKANDTTDYVTFSYLGA